MIGSCAEPANVLNSQVATPLIKLATALSVAPPPATTVVKRATSAENAINLKSANKRGLYKPRLLGILAKIRTEGKILLPLWREWPHLTYGSAPKNWLDEGREADTWNV